MIPMPLEITKPVYPTVFYFFLFLIPLVGPAIETLEPTNPHNQVTALDWLFALAFSAFWVGGFFFIQWRCSSWAASYWDAIGAKSVGMESGCVNVSVFYILPMLFWYHLKFLGISVGSLFSGQATAQIATLDLVRSKLPKWYPYDEVVSMIKAGITPEADYFDQFDPEAMRQRRKAATADAAAEAFEQMRDD